MKKKKTVKSIREKRTRQRKTISEYLKRHGHTNVMVKNQLSSLVVNGKQMSCAERDNLIVYLYKQNYDSVWIAKSLNTIITIVDNVISTKGKR